MKKKASVPHPASRALDGRNQSALRRPSPAPLVLEQRLIFDAEGARPDASSGADLASAMDGTGQDLHSIAPSEVREKITLAQELAVAALPKEVVFIDTSVKDWQTLVAQVKSDAQVFLLDPSGDAFAQIQAALAGMSDISALHLVSHGSEGTLIFGSKSYTAETIGAHKDALAAIGRALTADADVLLYGCDVGEGAAGAALIGRIAAETGADVAASTDVTGTVRVGGNWVLERATGRIEGSLFASEEKVAAYDHWLSTIPLDGRTGWTAILFGTNQDPVGDSQAGAADTDIVGDVNHGSLYTAYETNGTDDLADDSIAFRLRIDNPTSSSNFGGVAIVGIDVNGDGRVDLFISVDGRNNTQAVRLLDPGTGANISPNTTSTSPLPIGWLPNNGVYPFATSNYSVVAVSAATDPHWNGVTDIGNDGKLDVFVSCRVPIADLATVLAKASPVDRNGVHGPRGSTGIANFDQNTVVRYVSFTQTQPGPINGDLNGVGASYDKNLTFTALGAFTAPMSASSPVPSGPVLMITAPNGGAVLNDNQDDSVAISGTSTYLANKTLTLRVSDGVTTVTGATTTAGDGTWTVAGLNLSGLGNGTLSVTATVDPDANVATTDDVVSSAILIHDKTPPAIAINQLATAISGRPTFTGTSDLPDGSLITITIDPDNNPLTANLVYQVLVSAGAWSLNTSTVAPVSGAMSVAGLTNYTKVTATAADASGNMATATALDRPIVNALSTNNTTPTITGSWMKNTGDVLTVSINGATYTLSPVGNSWALNLATAVPSSGALGALAGGNSYEVVVTVTRGGTNASDTTASELTIVSTPIVAVGIDGGATVNGADTTPVITGTSQNAGGFVIVRLDPNNDGDLSDAVTYSVAPDGSGIWSLDTGLATPISGSRPTAGFIGATGVRATDSTGTTESTQVLTVTTPSIAIGTITSTATTDVNGVVGNSGGGAGYLNMTEDDAVTISGTATAGFSVDVTVTDVSGNFLEYLNVTVAGDGTWSITGKDLSALDNGALAVSATLSGTSISAVNGTVVHDKVAPRIFITNPSEIKKNGGVVYGGSELPNTALTIVIRNADDTSTVGTWNTTTDANGRWTVTTSGNLVAGSSGYVIIKVSTTATPTTDVAGNKTQTAQVTQYVAANATTSSIAIAAIATDNVITVGEIGSGLAITGTTTLAGSGSVTVQVTDGTTPVTIFGIYSGGTWSASLTKVQLQAFRNGQLTVTASAADGAITIADVALPTLSLPTPVLEITDDAAGTAAGPVTFTFTFTEAVTGFNASDITVTGGTKGAFSGTGTTYTLVVTPNSDASGNIVVSVASNVANGVDTGRANTSGSETQAFNTTAAAAAPTLTIDTSALATAMAPVITGTTSLSAGAPIVINIDADNDGVTDLTYAATVQSGGTWTLDTSSAIPSFGSLPAEGLNPFAKIVATATNAFGIGATAIGLNSPTVAGSVSNDSTPTITGTWTQVAGDTLSVVVNGVTYSVTNGNLVVTATGWSLTPAVPLADNTYEVAATVTRASGGTAADLTSNEVSIDTLATVTISGGAAVDLTGDLTPVISGTTSGVPEGTVVTLGLDINNDGSTELVYKTTVSAGGAWSVDTSAAIPASGVFPAAGLGGIVKLTATATDPAGNIGSDTQVLTVDVTAPVIALSINSKTSDITPVIKGTTDLPAGSLVTVEIDPDNDGDWSDVQTYVATVQTGGTWSVEATTAISGTVGVRAFGADAIGNLTITAVKPLELVANAPSIVVTSPILSVGVDNVANATEDDSVVLAGTTSFVPPGSTVNVTVTDGTITISDTAIVQANGFWALAALNLSTLANGQISVTAVVVDNDGSAYADSTSFTHDKSATISIDGISEDTGLLADFVTKDSAVSISGSATPGGSMTVVVKNAATATVATFNLTATAGGTWTTADTSSLSAGNYTIEATVSGTTVTKAMTIVDATPPVLSASSPVDDAASVTINSNLELTFSTDIVAGSGFITLYQANGALVESFNVTTGVGDAGGTLVFNGTTGVALNPHVDLAGATSYYIKVESTAVIDAAGNAFAGINNATTLNFTTVGIDATAPAITGPSGNPGDVAAAKTINENTTAVATLNANETVTWSLVSGADQAKFAIDASTGALSFVSAPNFEVPTDSDGNNTYVVQVRAVDGSGNASTQTITVTITDVDETIPDTTVPLISGPSGSAGDAAATKTINENTTSVATLSANEAVTWSLVGGADQAKFAIDASTGALSFVSAPNFEMPTDSDGNNAYVVQVRAVDGSGNASTQTITITIADVDETIPDTTAPIISGPSGGAGDAAAAKTINENTTAAATLSANEVVTWSLVGGADLAKFAIDASTGALSFLSGPDFEVPTDSDGNNAYVVQVRAVDGSGNASTQTITVTIADVDETIPDTAAPFISGPSGSAGDAAAAKTINENTTAVATLSANEAVTWSLVGGVDQAKFAIDASTGALSFVSAPNFEMPTDSDGNNTYVVQVRAVDGSGYASTQTITVTIADVAEGPIASPINNATVEIGSPLGAVLVPAFSSGDGKDLVYAATLADGSALPAWMKFDSTARSFSGTPPAGTATGDLTIRVMASDGQLTATANFVLQITAPAAPVAQKDAADATEAGGIGHSLPGVDPVGNVLGNDSGSGLHITNVQVGGNITGSATALSGGSAQITGAYGALTLQADGSYAYVVNSSLLAVSGLNTGETLTDTFTYQISDKAGQTSTAVLSVAVHGVTDQLPPVVPIAPPAPPMPTTIAPPAVAPSVEVTSIGFISIITAPFAAQLPLTVAEELGARGTWAATVDDSRPPTTVRSFEMAVIPGDTSRLVIYRGMPDQFSEADSVIRFIIPADAFAHEKESSEVIFTATLMDGSALPSWLVFDRINGTFSGVAPRGYLGELKIKVIARDGKGQQAEALFRFNIGKIDRPPHAKVGLSAQIRGVAYMNSNFHGLDVALR